MSGKQSLVERKVWKAQEDAILKKLFEELHITKWSQIARKMQECYGIQGRTGKQCRQRYHNHLKGGISKANWTSDEEEKLINLHVEHGNRWAFISKQLPGRTENCIKNMLYSKLRKSVRQLNRLGTFYIGKIYKAIKINFIQRLIDFTECAYGKSQHDRTLHDHQAMNLKNTVLKLKFSEQDSLLPSEQEQFKKIIEEIHQFKKNTQRFRGGKTHRRSKQTINRPNDMIQEINAQSQPVQSSPRQEQWETWFQEVPASKQESQMVEKKMEEMFECQNESKIVVPIWKQTNIQNKQKGKFKSRVLKKDSLLSNRSNRSCLLVDTDMEKPIQYQLHNLTPTTPLGLISFNCALSSWGSKWNINENDIQ